MLNPIWVSSEKPVDRHSSDGGYESDKESREGISQTTKQQISDNYVNTNHVDHISTDEGYTSDESKKVNILDRRISIEINSNLKLRELLAIFSIDVNIMRDLVLEYYDKNNQEGEHLKCPNWMNEFEQDKTPRHPVAYWKALKFFYPEKAEIFKSDAELKLKEVEKHLYVGGKKFHNNGIYFYTQFNERDLIKLMVAGITYYAILDKIDMAESLVKACINYFPDETVFSIQESKYNITNTTLVELFNWPTVLPEFIL